MNKLRAKLNRRGFSLAEVLLVVAIIGVLAALAAPNLIQMRKELRQKELDAKAEIIFLAAQNRLMQLHAAGMDALYLGIGEALPGTPLDMSVEEDAEEGGDAEKRDLRYLYVDADGVLMNEDTVSADLLADGWVIEFEPNEGALPGVYAVFCSADWKSGVFGAKYLSLWEDFNALRQDRATRAKGHGSVPGVTVGYYGGEVSFVSMGSENNELQPMIEVKNGETLTVTLKGKRQNQALSPRYTLTMTDALDPSKKVTEVFTRTANVDGLKLDISGNQYAVTLTLDDLSAERTRFAARYGSVLTPGHPIRLSLKIEYLNDGEIMFYKTFTRDEPINSLFDDDTALDETTPGGATLNATIRCGRHLQNLESLSGVTGKVAAVQTGNIGFAGGSEWYTYYSGADGKYFNGMWSPWASYGRTAEEAKFRPIQNGGLVSYDGGGHTISHLCAQAAGDAGLFAALGGTTVENVRLVGARVSSNGGNAGTLAGAVTGGSIVNCGAYLADDDVSDALRIVGDADVNPVWVRGANAGGLVGAASGGEIVGSFAAAVVRGSACAGGLVGSGSAVALQRSYADCYLFSDASTGGLVGSGSASSVVACYAAGYQKLTSKSGSYAAGLVNGGVTGTFERSYTVCDLADSGAGTLYATAASGSASNVYYLNQNKTEQNFGSSIYAAEVGKQIEGTAQQLCIDLNSGAGAVFGGADNASARTKAYNLDKIGRTAAYGYPYLRRDNHEVEHYGDWMYTLEEGGLVYYEVYSQTNSRGRVTYSYGISGAGAVDSIVRTGNVVGDGYGVVYSDRFAAQQKNFNTTLQNLEIYINGERVSDPLQKNDSSFRYYTVRDNTGLAYRVYPLKKSIVNAPATSTTEFYTEIRIGGESADRYFFNPHFAQTVIKVSNIDVSALSDEERAAAEQVIANAKRLGMETVAIRTPRHLYDLSLYYDAYFRGAIRGALGAKQVKFTQGRSLSYTAYDWYGYTTYNRTITEQEPIGRTEATAFRDVFDGGCYYITDVSFVSEAGSYVGMIGCNDGAVRNVVLGTEYYAAPENDEQAKRYFVQRKQQIGENDRVSMGVLVGENRGSIYNCAVAGYYICGQNENTEEITLHAFLGSTLYAGGLVGLNEGTINSSSADTPEISLSSTDAYVYTGGFVGYNSGVGQISNCYALGHLNVAYATRGEVKVGGFAGRNTGSVASSYCAVSYVTSGDSANGYGFAPVGGNVAGNCYYLDKGTYRYAGALHAYNNLNKTSGSSRTYEQLRQMRIVSANTASSAFCSFHTNVEDKQAGYPFRAVLQDGSANLVHYGDWQEAPDLGALGVFYWEHEVEGTNSGYHLSYLGLILDKGKAYSADIADTTLCTAHDDGGRITEFGYGFFVSAGEEKSLSVSAAGLSFSGRENYNRTVARELEQQMGSYTFFPFTTGVKEGDDDKDYLYLDNGEGRTGTWSLTYQGKTYAYEIAPFFANAMRRDGGGRIALTSTDGSVSDLSKQPGTQDNVFEVRSVDQLQYINWNYETKDNHTLIFGKTENAKNAGGKCDETNTGNNFKQFPYLQYATVLKAGKQLRKDAEANRPKQYWTQSHDLNGKGVEGYTPIAGMATSSPFSDGTAVNILYAWFGGSYDGQSYKIQDLDVISPAFSVGLFGVTGGADIKNVILYSSDGTSVVKRATAGKTGAFGGETVIFESAAGAYMVGGLIGIANDYDATANGTSVNTISNCAIAGYQVIDSSTNQQGAGTANVGGLIGLCSVNLENCSAVTDILIACKHENGHMAWGSQERVGGLTGSAGGQAKNVSTVHNCYTGGSIRVDGDANDPKTTLGEFPKLDGNGYALRDQKSTGYSSNIFVAGMVAGAYAPNISNFTGETSNAPDRQAEISNCYTYVDLPDLEGTIRSVSLFAGPGDRYGKAANKITLSNCYYLDSIADINYPKQDDPTTWPAYFFVRSRDKITPRPDKIVASELASLRDPTTLATLRAEGKADALIEKYKMLVITDDVVENMLAGDLNYLDTYLSSGSNQKNIFGTAAQAKDFEALSAETFAAVLNKNASGPWGYVSVTEGPENAPIPGKYSFSSKPAQLGKDYPFPTVLTQKDLTYSTPGREIRVNVHYGAWPINGDYWGKGLDTMDLFSDMNAEGEAVKTFKLYGPRVTSGEGGEEETIERSFRFSLDDIAQLVSVDYVDATESEPGHYNVTLRAFKTGTVTVTEETSGASFVLTVLAGIELTSEPEASNDDPLLLYLEEIRDLKLRAKAGEKDLSADGTWTLGVAEESDENKIVFPEDEPDKVYGGTEAGSFTIKATFDYRLVKEGEAYSSTLFIPAKTLGVVGLAETATEQYAAVSRSAAKDKRLTAGESGGLTLSDKPTLKGPQAFLFNTAADGDMDRFTVETVGSLDAGYHITVSEEIGAVDGYDCRPVYVTYDGGGAPNKNVMVTLRVTDNRSGKSYTLSVRVAGENVGYHTITFDGNGDGVSGYMPAASCGATYRLPANTLKRLGYRFVGWNTSADGSGASYEDEATVTLSGDLTLYACWEPANVSVTYDLNGGTVNPAYEGTKPTEEPLVEELQTGSYLTLPESDYFVNSNYEFWYWRVLELNLKLDPGERIPLESDVTVQAVWKGVTYNVRYYPGSGASGEPYTEAVRLGEPFTLPGADDVYGKLHFTPPSGKNLTGWTTSPDALSAEYMPGAEVDELTGAVGRTVPLYAVWGDGYLSLWSDGFNASFAVSRFDEQTDIAALAGKPLPTRDGWTLDGWYAGNSAAAVKILDAQGRPAVTEHTVLPAGFTYNADGSLTLSGSATLNTGWTRSGFVRVDKMESGDAAEGDYLIVAHAWDTGSKTVLTRSGDNVGSGTVTILSSPNGSVYTADGTGGLVQPTADYIYIADDTAIPTGAVWTAEHVTPNRALQIDGVDIDRYLFKNGDRHLRANANNSLELRQNTTSGMMYNGDYNDRHIWTFGITKTNGFQDENNAKNNHKYLTWSASENKWKMDSGEAFLFRLETIYCFG